MRLSAQLIAAAALHHLAPALAATVGQATILYDFAQNGVEAFGWTRRQATFTATSNQTILQFLTRNDYNVWYFDDISVNKSGTATNLVSNGDFEAMLYYGQCGNGAPLLAPWLLVGSSGPCTDNGLVLPVGSAADNGANSFLDSQDSASDSLSQLLQTEPRALYTLYFYVKFPTAIPAGSQGAIRVLESDFAKAPTDVMLDPGYDTGVSSTDGITAYQGVYIQGTTIPRQAVTVYVNGVASGSTYVGEDGIFRAYVGLPLGNNSITAQLTYQDRAGPLSAQFYAVYKESGPLPIPTLAASSDTGNKGDSTTHLTTITLEGTADSGGVALYGYDATYGTSASTTTRDDGSYSITFTGLAIGQHPFYVYNYDLAGNIHYSAWTGYLYVQVVAIPSTPALVRQNGVANIDTDTTIYFTATGTPGNTLTIYEDAVALQTVVLGSDASDASNTQASFAFAPSRAGVLTYNATQTDLRGEVSFGSNSFAVTVHPLAPVLLRLQGFSGTPPNITTNDLPILVGTGNAGALVTILNANNTVANAGLTGSDGTFAITVPVQSVGQQYLTANASLNGQSSLVASDVLQITVNPVAPVITGIANITGTPPKVADTVMPKMFTGTAYPGASLTLTDENNQIVGQGSADGAGRFAIPVSAYSAVGNHAVAAIQTVASQNADFVSAQSAVFQFTVFPSAPGNIGLEGQPGSLHPTITTSQLPTITGTASANASISIKDGNSTIATGSANAQGNFIITLQALTVGNHTVTAVAGLKDPQGNTKESARSSPPLVISVIEMPPVPSSSSTSTSARTASTMATGTTSPSRPPGAALTTTTTPAGDCSVTMVMYLTSSTIWVAAGAGGGSPATNSMQAVVTAASMDMKSLYGCVPVTSTIVVHK